ncbi:LGFP repeat-containing protein [Streptomyces sp. SD31]|uniref:LGFP repeat-containing protein n=1 Tax=Streptomyces sp. SD31 TaxID=3452208 RepID=UPI003F8AF9E0
MRTVTARRSLAAAAVALAAVLTVTVPAAADSSSADVCEPISRNEYIADRWQDLGGANGWLGCPINTTKNVTVGGVWKGKRQTFENGQITWSPGQGTRMVIAAWEWRGYAFADWGTTAPYSYDRFLLRYYSSYEPRGEQRELRGGTSGRAWVRKHTTGSYRFIVEGCDDGTFGSTCRQGWTLSASTR